MLNEIPHATKDQEVAKQLAEIVGSLKGNNITKYHSQYHLQMPIETSSVEILLSYIPKSQITYRYIYFTIILTETYFNSFRWPKK